MKNLFKFPLKKSFPDGYQRVELGGSPKGRFEAFRQSQIDLLRMNGVSTHKIRFVFSPVFTYVTDKNVVNPEYTTYIPIRKDGKFRKDDAVIELNKPANIVTISVLPYKVEDNYEFLNELVKQSKKGIVIFIHEPETHKDFNGEEREYGFTVDSEVLRLYNLDEVEVPTEESCQIL